MSMSESRSENANTRPAKCVLEVMDINISETEKRVGPSLTKMQETFTVYMIETKMQDPKTNLGLGPEVRVMAGPYCLWRRYSEFELLRNYLEIIYAHVVVPPLPEKRTSHTWQKLATDNFDPDFVERRRQGLETFLHRVASHPELGYDVIFIKFVQQDDGWKDSVHATDYQAKTDSKLKTLTSGFRVKNPDKFFDELRTYSSELQGHLNSILKIRAQMADFYYGTHRLHSNYGRVFSELAGADPVMADGLQTAGHYMDVYSSSIEPHLEEEEAVAEQLKEYYHFCESLKHVCKKQECMQLDLESAEDHLAAKRKEKEQLVSGKTGWSLGGVKSKIFGGDTPEQKELKLQALEEQIADAENLLQVRKDEHSVFTRAARRDVERFQRQKVKDIREIFITYAIMQVKMCKKGIAVWQSAKDAFIKLQP